MVTKLIFFPNQYVEWILAFLEKSNFDYVNNNNNKHNNYVILKSAISQNFMKNKKWRCKALIL